MRRGAESAAGGHCGLDFLESKGFGASDEAFLAP